MRVRRMICMVLSCVLIIGTMEFPVNAAMADDTPSEVNSNSFATPFATGAFNMTIPANTKLRANSSFPLAAGETITIKASYSPFSANVEFLSYSSIHTGAVTASFPSV